MSTNHIELFLSFLSEKDIPAADPTEIIADDRRRYYTVLGDSRGKKSGKYQLKIDGGFAVGRVTSFKQGISHTYISKRNKDFSEAEKLEYKKKMDAARKVREREIAREREEAAIKAVKIWDRSSKGGTTEYLSRKKCDLVRARVWRDLVVVPVYKDKKLSSVQLIAPDGQKRFLKGGEIEGGYCPLANKGDDLSTIVITEGFATGDAIKKSTGLPVIVAFNCGNLLPVAKIMREENPDSKIIIAADNDAYTVRPDGTPWNPGVEKAKEIFGKIVNCSITWPEFVENNEAKYTDFNDAYVLFGKEYVKEKIESAKNYGMPVLSGGSASISSDLASQGGAITKDNWRLFLHLNKEEKIKKGSLHNLYLFLCFHEQFEGLFAYNEFHHNITLMRCPIWESGANFEAKTLDDLTVNHTTAALESYGFTTPDTGKVNRAIEMAANYKKFHPGQDYFNSLVWDRQPRLEKWLTYYLGCEHESAEYLAFIGKKWLTAGVKRIFEPGAKFDHVLVIEGEQGIYKSTALKKLATFGRDKPIEYFTDSVTIADIQNKDTIMKIQGSIIVELSELSGFSKKDDEEIKRWITVQHDAVRLPYARQTSNFKRQFILAATTNKYDYLKDPTGNRRYWPVKAEKIDISAIDRDKEQLWAEAVVEYKNGLYLGPTEEEEKLANFERQKRLMQDPWTDTVLDKLTSSGRSKFKISEILDDMGLHLRDKDARAANRVTNILQHNGFINKPIWDSYTQKTTRFWVRPEGEVGVQEEMEIPY